MTKKEQKERIKYYSQRIQDTIDYRHNYQAKEHWKAKINSLLDRIDEVLNIDMPEKQVQHND